MQAISAIVSNYLTNIHMPSLRWTDAVEIFIIAFLAYHIMLWVKTTRAWSLVKGIGVILVFILAAVLFNMTTILWIVRNVTGLAVTALIVILQPELRNAMEELGQKNFFTGIFSFDAKAREGRFSDKTLSEIVRACVEMGKKKTGALIVIEQNTPLREYEKTGIDVDAVVTSQLLINIFEKNTPLHDGAVIIRRDRITSATCYLPLSDNKLDKDLGTRHRAGVGISEVTDSLTLIVSEETGKISAAYKGKLERALDAEALKARLAQLQDKSGPQEEKPKRRIVLPGRGKKG